MSTKLPTGPELDLAVALACGLPGSIVDGACLISLPNGSQVFRPSTDLQVALDAAGTVGLVGAAMYGGVDGARNLSRAIVSFKGASQ